MTIEPESGPTSAASAEFRLSIMQALGEQLHDALLKLTPDPLDEQHIGKLKAEGGVYQLYHMGQIVYTGKAESSVPERLRQHRTKLSGRSGIKISDMSFTCIYVGADLPAVAPETLLIGRFKSEGLSKWNGSGFGGKDKGRERDTTRVKAAHFDASFPINLDVEVSLPTGTQTAKYFLKSLKDELSYFFRFDGAFWKKDGIALTELVNHEPKLTAKQAFEVILKALPQGWQITALPGAAILYEENEDPHRYESALAWWRLQPDGTVKETPGPRSFDMQGEVDEDD